MPNAARIVDVTLANFEDEVVERSKTTPVLMDFWATWCGPCKTLTPILEKLAGELAGSVVLAKVDIDQNPDLAQAFAVQSVPMVVLVKDGRPVDGFVGVQPEGQIRALLEGHLDDAADPLGAALELEKQGEAEAAAALLADHLQRSPDHGEARAQLARLLVLAGRVEEGRAEYERLGDTDRESDAGRAAAALLELQQSSGDLDALRAAVESAPDDVAPRLALGRALIATQNVEDGLEELYTAALRDLRFNDDEPRKALIEAFEMLGEQNPLTIEYRRRLSMLLTA